uniref:Ribosomal protein L10 n=1 Tax=Eukaryota sp. BB2 TaxID=1949062 RepID=A0A1W5QHC9_9EUKA|nr:ribosomal protein L10 [Eukaryota sp. BB2]AQL10459.1 ribosomal protein L10 [Eukaryota sp. BB2]
MPTLKHLTYISYYKSLLLGDTKQFFVYPFVLFFKVNYISSEDYINLKKICQDKYNLICVCFNKKKATSLQFPETFFKSLFTGTILIIYPNVSSYAWISVEKFSFEFKEFFIYLDKNYSELVFLLAKWNDYFTFDRDSILQSESSLVSVTRQLSWQINSSFIYCFNCNMFFISNILYLTYQNCFLKNQINFNYA